MRKNLPYLNQERLDVIFNVSNRLDDVKAERAFEEKKLNHLLRVLKTMRDFNLEHCPEDRYEVFHLTNGVFNFETNSEGTDYWLAIISALKELHGFSDDRLVSVMGQVGVRK